MSLSTKASGMTMEDFLQSSVWITACITHSRLKEVSTTFLALTTGGALNHTVTQRTQDPSVLYPDH